MQVTGDCLGQQHRFYDGTSKNTENANRNSLYTGKNVQTTFRVSFDDIFGTELLPPVEEGIVAYGSAINIFIAFK